MHDEFPAKFDIVWRPRWSPELKSAGVLPAASTTGLGAASGASQVQRRPRTRRRECSSRGPPQGAALHKGKKCSLCWLMSSSGARAGAAGAAAEQAGFDMLATSDHFQPWQANERHAGEAWVTLGALGQQTRRVWMGPTVTILHPLQPGGRCGGVCHVESSLSGPHLPGTGQASLERAGCYRHLARVAGALGSTHRGCSALIRQLWSGNPVQHKGTHYTVNGKLYDPPPQPIPLLLAANGPKAMRLAGLHGDGLITDPNTWKESKG